MVFESALVLTPIIIAIATVTFKRIEKVEERIDELPQLFVTKSEMQIHMSNIESKLERIELKLDFNRKITQLETENELKGYRKTGIEKND
jgi:hypothetical protein